MALNNPGVEVTLRNGQQVINPQSYHARGIVIGYSSRLTRNQLYVMRGQQDLPNAGNGEGIEQVAEIGAQAGFPVGFIPVDGTGQTPGNPDKTPASGAVAFKVLGKIKLPGADANGDIIFSALVDGATLTVQSGGALAATTNGAAVVFTIPAGTAANDVETWWNGVSAEAVAARAVFSISTEGTGASNAGTTLATTNSNLGNLSFSAPDEGYEVRVVVSGNNTALSASYGGTGNKQLTINLATDADGTPTSTATAVKTVADAALPLPATGRISIAIVGAGGGLAGSQASFYPLVYGSSAALAVSGTSHDQFTIGIRFLTGGAVGSTGIAYEWTADGWVTTSAPTQLPVSGIINTLRDSVLDTGLTLTVTGTIERGDKWEFVAPKPVVSFAAIQTAIDALLALTGLRYGFVVATIPHTRTQLALAEAPLLAARNRVWLRYRAPMRDLNDGETRAQYEAALAADLLGYNSDKGMVLASGGYFSHLSTYSRRNYRRPATFVWNGRRCSLALHQDPMQKDLGPLPNMRYAKAADGSVIDAGIYYDAYPTGSLPSARLMCLRTFDSEGDGRFFINNSVTLSDASQPQYSRAPYVDVLFETARAATYLLEQAVIGKSFTTISAPEGDLIPAGALSFEDAERIDTQVNAGLEALLKSIKTDGNASVGDLEPGQKIYQTRRDYSYAASDPKKVLGRIRIKLRGIAEYAEVDITPEF